MEILHDLPDDLQWKVHKYLYDNVVKDIGNFCRGPSGDIICRKIQRRNDSI